MPAPLRTAIAVPFVLDGAQQIVITDSGTGSPRTQTMDSGTYRTFLAQTGTGTPGQNAGTEADPRELLALFEHYLNTGSGGTLWSVTLTAFCYVLITYLGTGTGEIDFASADVLALVLGFDRGMSLHVDLSFVGTNSTHTADFPPMFFGATASRSPDTGWTGGGQRFSSSLTASGVVFGWGNNTRIIRRKWTANAHPYQWDDVSSLLTSTVMWPTTLAQAQTITRTPVSTYELPWSFYETVQCAGGVQIAVAHGNLQDIIANTDDGFDICYVDPDTINAKEPVRLTQPGFNKLRNYVDIGLTWYAVGER